MNIAIAVPSLDHCSTDFAISLAALCMKRAYDRKLSKQVELALLNHKGSVVMEARNTLVAQAQEVKATHIFFLDSDIVVPPNALDRLIAWHKPIVAASYVKRVPPHQLLGVAKLTTTTGTPMPLVEMESIPLGCALISMKVFEALPRPYFAYLTTPEGSMSEDTYFSHAARNAGFTIHLDTALTKEIGHVGSKIYRP